MLPNGDIPRVDRLFELHEEAWFRRKELNESADLYWEFLQQPHDFPIYMQAVHPRVPSSVKYPKAEVFKDLFSSFDRPFMTSSIGWMFALAIHEKYERIELYGCEMQYGTEYYYQQPGGTFMIGLALGRGIEVVLHEKSTLCRAKLYGFETAPYASKDVLNQYHAYYTTRQEELLTIASKQVERWNHIATNGSTPEEKAIEQSHLMNAISDVALVMGGREMVGILLEESDEFASRQKLEGYQSQYRIKLEKWKGEANFSRAAYNSYLQNPAPQPQEAHRLWLAHKTAWEQMHGYQGGLQVIEKLMDECDMRHVEMELVQRIEEQDAEPIFPTIS